MAWILKSSFQSNRPEWQDKEPTGSRYSRETCFYTFSFQSCKCCSGFVNWNDNTQKKACSYAAVVEEEKTIPQLHTQKLDLFWFYFLVFCCLRTLTWNLAILAGICTLYAPCEALLLDSYLFTQSELSWNSFSITALHQCICSVYHGWQPWFLSDIFVITSKD